MTAQAALYQALGPLVDGLSPTRARLRDLFDDWLADSGIRDAPSGFVHAVMAAAEACHAADLSPRPEDSTDALRLALAALGKTDHAYASFCAMVAAGLFDHGIDARPATLEALSRDFPSAYDALRTNDPDVFDLVQGQGDDALDKAEARALARKILTARALACIPPEAPKRMLTHATEQRATHEALTAPDDFWSDPGTLLPALLLGRRRLCLIRTFDENGEPTTGTGFLVGPSAVLTNWHVVQGVGDRLDNPDDLLLQFDFSETTAMFEAEGSTFAAQEDWCIARGQLADKGPDEAFWWDDTTKRKAWLDLVKDQLDFAIIRLDGAPGLQRGWYPLSTARRRRPSGSWALHHPSARQHTITRGQVKHTRDFGHRIFHTASTVGGSSGGLILDQDGEPMGLHYLALEAGQTPDPAIPAQKNEVLNVAIGLREIAEALEADGTLASLTNPGALRPRAGCVDRVRPIFGREALFSALTELWTSERKRILRVDLTDEVRALQRPGKSFTSEILRGIFRGPEHHHILFRAGDLKVDARRVAQDALRSFAEDLVDAVPETQDTTTPAYVRRLVSFMAQSVRERLPGKAIWVVLDDLEKHDLSDASGREFLSSLYAQIDQMPNLRIVLIGLPQGLEISGIQLENVLVSHLDTSDLEGLEDKFIRWLKERGGRNATITDEGYRFLAEIVTSTINAPAPLEAMSGFVVKHITPAADRLFGAVSGNGGDGQ